MDGELTCDHLHGLAPTAYRCGAVFGIEIEVGGLRIYHQGSANLDDDELRIPARTTSSSPGSPGAASRLSIGSGILPRLDPRLVVPTHYDNFFAPLGSPQRYIRGVRLADLPAEIGCGRGRRSPGGCAADRPPHRLS
jgi:hypothetical protein